MTTGSPPLECGNSTGGTFMVPYNFTNLTSVSLPRGNFTANYGNETSGQEQLYFCINKVGAELTAQSYSTANESYWTLKIST